MGKVKSSARQMFLAYLGVSRFPARHHLFFRTVFNVEMADTTASFINDWMRPTGVGGVDVGLLRLRVSSGMLADMNELWQVWRKRSTAADDQFNGVPDNLGWKR